jgi:class 3 adenylate cyclase
MRELPTGTVTFLFTDLAGSTRLLRQLRDRYSSALAEHRRLLRAECEEHGGHEVDTQGDAFFFAFARAKDAVNAAVAGQRALARHQWPDSAEVRVRMALHTGEPELAEEGYVGLGLTRGARILAAGHGGQILLSRSTAGVVEEDELPGIEVRDLGDQTFKDLERPERVYQLVVEGLPDEFPPLNTLADLEKKRELAEAARAARLPGGTVTFLCTDIVGYTRMSRELGIETWGRVMDDHDRLLRAAFDDGGGREIAIAGDTFIYCFTAATDAAHAAAEAERALARHDWPEGVQLAVRVGLHTGEAVPVGRHYAGAAVNRVSSVCGAAHGGRVLLSQSTASLLDEDDLRELGLRDLGEQELAMFARPVRLYQLLVPGLPEEFPPLAVAGRRP